MAVKFKRTNGALTTYALACGYLNATTVDDDKQAITMGMDDACYFVKSRVDPGLNGERSLSVVFPRDNDGYRRAMRLWRTLSRNAGCKYVRGYYRDSNPKINCSILCSDGRTEKYLASTNYFRTCREAVAYFRAVMPQFVILNCTREPRA